MRAVAPGSTTKRVNFTKANLGDLKLPIEGRSYVYDSKQPGLCVCLTAAGSRTFYLYRKVNGKPERIRLGTSPEMTVEQARTKAAGFSGKIADGINPNDKRRVNRNAPTLGQVFGEYIETPTRGKAKRPRSPKTTKDYRWQFDKHLAEWRDRQLSKITRADVESLHNRLGTEHGHYMANRILALVKAVFNYAVECDYYPLNPATRLHAFEETSRERFLSADEMPRFWQAVEQETAADFYKLLLLTGARRGNVLSARWEQIDLGAATWTIPHTKNGQALTLPLSPPALALLNARRQTIDSEWVFPNQDGTRQMPTPRHGWERILKRAGIENLRLHDLRRSLGSWQASGGSSLSVIGKSLGHASIHATKIYARVDLDAVRASVNTATAAILTAAKPAESKTQKQSRAGAKKRDNGQT